MVCGGTIDRRCLIESSASRKIAMRHLLGRGDVCRNLTLKCFFWDFPILMASFRDDPRLGEEAGKKSGLSPLRLLPSGVDGVAFRFEKFTIPLVWKFPSSKVSREDIGGQVMVKPHGIPVERPTF